MTVITLSNADLTVKIASLGAQIISVQDSKHQERIWQADPQIWGRHAPILFPIVGRLQHDEYYYQDKMYKMNQHGFARDQEFQVIHHSDNLVIFELTSQMAQINDYPFDFSLRIAFELMENQIQVNYSVQNQDTKEMYFSIGGHPGFNFDYQQPEARLVIEQPQQVKQLTFTPDHFVDEHTIVAEEATGIYFTSQSFVADTYIYQNRGYSSFSLWQGEECKLRVASDAPYFGVWSPYPQTASFVCIEPWWGVADTLHNDGELTHKFGINYLRPQQVFNASWKVDFY